MNRISELIIENYNIIFSPSTEPLTLTIEAQILWLCMSILCFVILEIFLINNMNKDVSFTEFILANLLIIMGSMIISLIGIGIFIGLGYIWITYQEGVMRFALATAIFIIAKIWLYQLYLKRGKEQ